MITTVRPIAQTVAEQHAAVLQAPLQVIGSLTARVDAALAPQTVALGPMIARMAQAEFNAAHHLIDLLIAAAAKSLATSQPIQAEELRPQPAAPATDGGTAA